MDGNMVSVQVEDNAFPASATNNNILTAEQILLAKGTTLNTDINEPSASDETTPNTSANAILVEQELASKGIIQNSQAPISQPGAVAVGAAVDVLMADQETTKKGGTQEEPGYVRYTLDETSHSQQSHRANISEDGVGAPPIPESEPQISPRRTVEPQPGAFPQAGINARSTSSSSISSYYYNHNGGGDSQRTVQTTLPTINDENNQGLVQANIVNPSQELSRRDLEVAEPIPEEEDENNNQEQQQKRRHNSQRIFVGGGVLLLVIVAVLVAVVGVLTRSGGERSSNQYSESATDNNTLEPTLAAPFLLALLPNSTQSVLLQDLHSSSSSQHVELSALSPPSQAYCWMAQDPDLGNYTKNRLLQRFAMATLYYSTDGPDWKHQGGGTVAIEIEGNQAPRPGGAPGSQFMPEGYAPHLQAGAPDDPLADPFEQGSPGGSHMPSGDDAPHLQEGAPDLHGGQQMQGGPHDGPQDGPQGGPQDSPWNGPQGGPPDMQGGPQGGPPHMQGGPQGGPPHMQGGPQGGPPHMQGGPQGGPPHMQGGPQGGPPHMQGGGPQGGPPHMQGGPQGGPPHMQGGPQGGPPFAELGTASSFQDGPSATLFNKTSAAWLDYNSHECDWFWYGRNSMCTPDDESVINFRMRNSNLAGSLPNEVGLLSSLLDIEITYNNLGGRIPSQIGLLTNLQRLTLASNLISGAIPEQIGLLRSVTYVNLMDNQLIGSLPAGFWQLPQLVQIKTLRNQFSGSLPTDMGQQLTNIQAFVIGDNLHTGSLPSSIGHWTRLNQLVAERNLLTGTLPTELGLMQGLSQLRMNENLLVGSLPSELSVLQTLGVITLQDNVGLSGSIPTEWNILNNTLVELNLLGTSITGTIPPNLCSVEALIFDCSASLCGCISCPCGIFNVSI